MRMAIIDLETAARQRKDRTSNVEIRNGQYLIVKLQPSNGFTYHWGNVMLAREGADLLLSEIATDRA